MSIEFNLGVLLIIGVIYFIKWLIWKKKNEIKK